MMLMSVLERMLKLKMKKNLLLTKVLLIGSLGTIPSFIYAQPVKAFAPYVYKPNTEMLEKTSIGIARTAAHLLELGQYKEAKKLASLAVRFLENKLLSVILILFASIVNEKIVYVLGVLFFIRLFNCLNFFESSPINSAGNIPTSDKTEYLPPI